MKKLMKSAYVEVQKLKGKGITEAPQNLLNEVSEKYDKIVTAALNRHKPPKKTNKRGRLGKGTIRALFESFRDYKEGVLLFLHDFKVPFSNNQALSSAFIIPQHLSASTFGVLFPTF
jgi:transposase